MGVIGSVAKTFGRTLVLERELKRQLLGEAGTAPRLARFKRVKLPRHNTGPTLSEGARAEKPKFCHPRGWLGPDGPKPKRRAGVPRPGGPRRRGSRAPGMQD